MGVKSRRRNTSGKILFISPHCTKPSSWKILSVSRLRPLVQDRLTACFCIEKVKTSRNYAVVIWFQQVAAFDLYNSSANKNTQKIMKSDINPFFKKVKV